MEVYELVKEYLSQVGLKQKAVAKKSGISERDFSLLMTGKKTLTACHLQLICNALNVSPTRFIKIDST